MKNIAQSYLIPATLAEVWRALTVPRIIEEWSDADAEFEPTIGFEYSLWDGSIGGEIVQVEKHKKLVQTWKPEDWTIDNSVVTFTLTPDGKATRVDLLHENVEDFDFAGTTEGWDLYYLGAIKRMFEARPRNAKGGNTKPAKKAKAAKKTTAKVAKGKTATKKKIVAKKSASKLSKKKK